MAFLASACAGDEELRREVELLFDQDAATAGLITGETFESAARTVAHARPYEGRRIGIHEVETLLGAVE